MSLQKPLPWKDFYKTKVPEDNRCLIVWGKSGTGFLKRGEEIITAVNSGLQQETREQATYCHQLFNFKLNSRRLGTSRVHLQETSGCGKSMSFYMGHYKFNYQHNPEKALHPILQMSNNDVKQETRYRFFASEWKSLNTITHMQRVGTN